MGNAGPGDTGPEEAVLRQRAEKRTTQKIRLLQSIGTFIVINGFMVVIWALTSAGYPWFLWVLAGWGLALSLQVVHYFVGSRGEAARERSIDRELERMRKRPGPRERE